MWSESANADLVTSPSEPTTRLVRGNGIELPGQNSRSMCILVVNCVGFIFPYTSRIEARILSVVPFRIQTEDISRMANDPDYKWADSAH